MDGFADKMLRGRFVRVVVTAESMFGVGMLVGSLGRICFLLLKALGRGYEWDILCLQESQKN